VIRLPHISNFNDFDPLSVITGLHLHFLEKVQDLSLFRAVIIPGSKNTRFDLEWLHATGWSERIAAYAKQDGNVLGICGGYQMMGDSVHDPDGIEGRPGTTAGLGLLPVETELKAPKVTTLTKFSRRGAVGSGYEIHMGQTLRKGGDSLFQVNERNSAPVDDEDGCIGSKSKSLGTYIHGLFDNPDITCFWLDHIGLGNLEISTTGGPEARDREYDLLAEHFENHIDTHSIMELIQ
jgi:adenosylcobyric acid synthase